MHQEIEILRRALLDAEEALMWYDGLGFEINGRTVGETIRIALRENHQRCLPSKPKKDRPKTSQALDTALTAILKPDFGR